MTVDVHSPYSGTVVEILAKEGDEVDVGAPLFVIIEGPGTGSSTQSKAAAPAATADKTPAVSAPPKTASAPPKADKAQAPAVSSPPTAAPATPKGNDRSENRVKMTRMRQRISQRFVRSFFLTCWIRLMLIDHAYLICRLKEAQNTAAMLTTFQEVDMGPLMDMRNKHKDEFEKKHGVKLGFMSAFVKVIATLISNAIWRET